MYTGISKIHSVHGNLKDQLKLDLCICEALSCTSVPWKPYLWAWLSISIKPIFRRRRSRRQWLLATKLATPIQLKYTWKYLEEPAASYSILPRCQYWTAVRHYTRYISNSNNKLTFFQKVLVFSDSKQSFKPWLIVFFGVLLLRLDTNSSHVHGRHYTVQSSLELKALNRSTAYKDHASASYVQLTAGWSRIAIKCLSCPWGIPGTKDVPGTSLLPSLLWDCL